MSDQQEIEVERVYTVPLSRAWIAARHRRTRRAVNILREFAEHHMKSSEIKIDTELNEALWKRGITKPPRRITVKMEKDEDGVVTVSLPKETKMKAPPEETTLPSKPEPSETQAVTTTSTQPVQSTAAVATATTASPAPAETPAPTQKRRSKKSPQ